MFLVIKQNDRGLSIWYAHNVYCTDINLTMLNSSKCLTEFDYMCNLTIRETCPCNEYTLKPHFYIEKLGFAGVYLFFLFLLQNIDCGYSLEPHRRGASNVYPQSMF